MRIAMVGAGYVGLVSGACFAEFGVDVCIVDTDASKVALVHLVARLNYGGFRLLDAQFVNPHLERLGAIQMPKARYHEVMEPLLAIWVSSSMRLCPARFLPLWVIQNCPSSCMARASCGRWWRS